jgi:hypothetical protein
MGVKRILMAACAVLALSGAAHGQDVPRELLGRWCILSGTNGTDADYHRDPTADCQTATGGSLDFRKRAFSNDDTFYVITKITKAPDHTYTIKANIKAEGGDRTVGYAEASAHVHGTTLNWKLTEYLNGEHDAPPICYEPSPPPVCQSLVSLPKDLEKK